ncbi:lytic transglycosylase domain-containing protein [Roseobacteraceae bacterium S113]
MGLADILKPALVAGLVICAGGAWAEGPKPFPEFEAKRVKPPKSGAKRITVQITPDRPAPEATTASASSTRAPRTSTYGWFWESQSPALDASGPGRLEPALTTIRNQGGVAGPRLQDLQNIAQTRGIDILKATIGTEVSPALALAVIAVESAGRADAVSSAGAQGLMQLMPATAERFDVSDALVPADNIRGGVAYLDWLMKTFDRDPLVVLAAYNAGEGSVRAHAGVPPFSETRDYVPKVLAAFATARGLCKTPPQLISDGCVFHQMQ